MTVNLSYDGGMGLNSRVHLGLWGWDLICAPVATLAEAMALRGGEVELRTAWEEFEWERKK